MTTLCHAGQYAYARHDAARTCFGQARKPCDIDWSRKKGRAPNIGWSCRVGAGRPQRPYCSAPCLVWTTPEGDLPT